MSRTLAIGITVIGLMFAWGIDTVTASTVSQLRAARAFKARQLHRDRGTLRFGFRRPWAFNYSGYRHAALRAVRRMPLEREQLHALRLRLVAVRTAVRRLKIAVARWQPTVDCENGGSWSDSPGFYLYGLQFDPRTWRVAAEHTGRWDGSRASQIANAEWTGAEARREGQPDPWPNCPDPYYG